MHKTVRNLPSAHIARRWVSTDPDRDKRQSPTGLMQIDRDHTVLSCTQDMQILAMVDNAGVVEGLCTLAAPGVATTPAPAGRPGSRFQWSRDS